MHEPLVTVLMPVYNGAKYLREAVESILHQSFADYEFLIINDGSSDATQSILESYADGRIRVLVNGTNQGISAALNLGLAQARGKYIARQDADDVSHPDRLARQVAVLEADSTVALLGTQCRMRRVQSAARRSPLRRALDHEAIKFQALFGNPFVHTSVMYRRAVAWTQLCGYSPAYRICQDYDLWLRMQQQHRVANLDEYLVDLRDHAESISRNPTSQDASARELLLQANMQLLISDCSGLQAWPQVWASGSFRPHSMTREDFRHLTELASSCLRRCIPGTAPRIRKQMRRAYGDYLLSITARQLRWQVRGALKTALLAAYASPAGIAAALVWIVSSWLEDILRRSRAELWVNHRAMPRARQEPRP